MYVERGEDFDWNRKRAVADGWSCLKEISMQLWRYVEALSLYYYFAKKKSPEMIEHTTAYLRYT